MLVAAAASRRLLAYTTAPKLALKKEFAGVKRSYIPLQCIVRIDEVDKEGAARISEGGGGKIAAFPVPPQGAAPTSIDD